MHYSPLPLQDFIHSSIHPSSIPAFYQNPGPEGLGGGVGMGVCCSQSQLSKGEDGVTPWMTQLLVAGRATY